MNQEKHHQKIYLKKKSNEIYDLIIEKIIYYTKNVKNSPDLNIATEDANIFIGIF